MTDLIALRSFQIKHRKQMIKMYKREIKELKKLLKESRRDVLNKELDRY